MAKKQFDLHREYFLLFIYGMVCAWILVYPYMYEIGNGWVPIWRCDRVTACYEILLEGGKFDFSYISHTLGYGFYFPYIMKFFKITNGLDMFNIAQTVCGMFVVCIYPNLVYKAFGSKVIALLSPFLVHISFGDLLYLNKACEYWSGLWATALTVPLLYLYIKEENEKRKLIRIAEIALVLSFSNILRGLSGLPVLILVGAVLFKEMAVKKISFLNVFLSIAILVGTFNLLAITIPDYVADKWGIAGKCNYNSSPWHSILIGMGYIENDYGLYYSDESGKEFIENRHPNVEYNSEEYFECCKKEAVQIFAKDPWFVIKGLFVKLGVCIRLQMKYTLGILGISDNYLLWILGGIGIELVYLFKETRGGVSKKYILEMFGGASLIFMSLYAGILSYPDEYAIWSGLGGIGVLAAFVFMGIGKEVLKVLLQKNFVVKKGNVK